VTVPSKAVITPLVNWRHAKIANKTEAHHFKEDSRLSYFCYRELPQFLKLRIVDVLYRERLPLGLPSFKVVLFKRQSKHYVMLYNEPKTHTEEECRGLRAFSSIPLRVPCPPV
jgi:hypothetical protein